MSTKPLPCVDITAVLACLALGLGPWTAGIRSACNQYCKSCETQTSVLATKTRHSSRSLNYSSGAFTRQRDIPSMRCCRSDHSSTLCSHDFANDDCGEQGTVMLWWAVDYLCCQNTARQRSVGTGRQFLLQHASGSNVQLELQSRRVPGCFGDGSTPETADRVDSEIKHPVRSQTRPRPYRE